MINKAMTRKVVSRNIGLPWKGDSGKGVRELGLSYRPLEETVVDFFQQMVDHNVFTSRS
jgi:dihydroflavonol-4-reductase